MFVLPFEDKSRRKYLIDRFVLLLTEIVGFGIDFEVWIDGSFATTKPNPEDIDLLFLFDMGLLNGLTGEQQTRLDRIFGSGRMETKIRYACDVYVRPIDDRRGREYWSGFFGQDREGTKKGIARLILHAHGNDRSA